jgi:hypothetical protein
MAAVLIVIPCTLRNNRATPSVLMPLFMVPRMVGSFTRACRQLS